MGVVPSVNCFCQMCINAVKGLTFSHPRWICFFMFTLPRREQFVTISIAFSSLFAQKERGCWQKNVKSCKQEAVCWHCTDPQNIQHNGKREGSLHAACVLQRLSCCCHPLIILILCLGLLFQNICSLMETFKCLDSTQLSLSRAIRCQIVFLYWNLWENCFDK